MHIIVLHGSDLLEDAVEDGTLREIVVLRVSEDVHRGHIPTVLDEVFVKMPTAREEVQHVRPGARHRLGNRSSGRLCR